jgi:hypothetical protein
LWLPHRPRLPHGTTVITITIRTTAHKASPATIMQA